MGTSPPTSLHVKHLDGAIELMGRGGRLRILPMRGESMLPTLRSGESIIVDFRPERIERGDLVLFRQADYLVVHRLLGPASREDGTPLLRTRGDGRSALDPPLPRDRLRGRVLGARIEGRWCGFNGAAARVYGLSLALHGLAWAGAGALARALDRRLRRLGFPSPLEGWTAAADRALLHAVHRSLFHRLHPRLPAPRSAADLERLLY